MIKDNPITGQPYASFRELDITSRVLAEMADPNFPLAQSESLRAYQARALYIGATMASGSGADSRPTELTTQEGLTTIHPLTSVIDVVPVSEARGSIDPRIERLHDQGQATLADGVGRNDTDRFARGFRTWRPHGQAELTLATQGLGSRIESASRYGIQRVEGELSKAQGFLTEASVDLEALKVLDNHQPEFDSRADAARLVRSDTEALGVITNERVEAIQFEKGKWLRTGYGPIQRLNDEVRTQILGLSDDDLLTAYQTTRTAVQARAGYWQGQLSSVEHYPMVQGARLERSHLV